ncbi:hypothetical protein R3P38DRAFT_3287354 [Favolaschia claudopus]|uniref:Uncharacterized protein n=1 Tax=Favolaschia claudopus TaxID=2862362 RepID=A0AAW0A137_9AGAR
MLKFWDGFVVTTTRSSDDCHQALSNGEKAIALYRELVALAPRHLPTLASSLQHLASIKWDLGCRKEAIVACDEAMQTLRNVAKSETCFLPTFADALDQHRALLVEQGDADDAAAVTAEAVEARKKFASLPPRPECLFEKVMNSSDEELDCWELKPSEEDRGALEELAGEGGEMEDVENQDGFDTPKIVEVVEAGLMTMEMVKKPSSPYPAATRQDTDSTPHSLAALVVPIAKVRLAEDFEMVETEISRATSPQTALKDVLNKPLKITLSMSMHSRPMDVSWWVLLGVLFAFVYAQVA